MSRRMKMTEDILEIMKNVAQIRNIALIGHIDHGKTTLSDSLLAEAGLLSETLAGEARVLDYLEEEQRRGITMKAANISLYYEHAFKNIPPFVINLVDTPGHLDFSGKVTRALRLVDGVVVIVDAVEEVSAQTETVLRQALEESARPLLYINKIDRLFRELKLDPAQIKDRFSRIIQEFNRLIYVYGDERAKAQWQVSAENGSVIFGSALHRWGFVIPQLAKKGINFSYFTKKYQDESFRELVKEFPVWEAVLAAVVQFLPNPLQAQQYRISKIWNGNLDSELGRAMQKCDPNGPLVICLSKVEKLKDRLVATGRIFSGKLNRNHEVYLIGEKKVGSLNRLSIFMGSRLENVEQLPAGNIAAIGGLEYVRSGETLIDPSFKDNASPFESVKYVSEPVVTVAVEPTLLKNLNQLQDLLEEIKIEDPNINVEISPETGECLVSGMGPLHLETIAYTIKERGVEVSTSKPSSVFRETIPQESKFHEATSPNGKNKIQIKLARLDARSVKYLRGIKNQILDRKDQREKALVENTSLTAIEVSAFWDLDEHQNLLIVQFHEESTGFNTSEEKHPLIGKKAVVEKQIKRAQAREGLLVPMPDQQISPEIRRQIIESIHNLTKHGLLAQEPLSELKIIVHDLVITSNKDDTNFFELSTMIHQAFISCLEEIHPILLEPIYKLMITSPESYIGTVSALISQYLGHISEIDQDQYRTYIHAFMSVRKSIEFSQELRSQTSGRVFWQTIFDSFQPVPPDQQEQIIQDIRFRKGLHFTK